MSPDLPDGLPSFEVLTSNALSSPTIRHNLAILRSITGGTELALADPIEFEPRAQYWYMPHRRFLTSWLAKSFNKWPSPDREPEFLGFLLELSHSLEAFAQTVDLPPDSALYNENGPAIPKAVSAFRQWATDCHATAWKQLQVRRSAAATVAQSLLLHCDAVESYGFTAVEPSAAPRLRWYPAHISQDVVEFEKAERFFFAFSNAVRSHNAYRKAGAQFLGPVISNTSTGVFLDTLAGWREGKTRAECPFRGITPTGDALEDMSHTNVAGELWGFFNLHRRPFVNNKVKTYRRIHADVDQAATWIGQRTRDWLESNSARAEALAQRFDELVADPELKSAFRPLFARNAHTSPRDAQLNRELREAAQRRFSSWSAVDKAAVLLHIALDRAAYQEAKVVAEPAPPGFTTTAASSKPSRLLGASRVWLYAPGRDASHWEHDLRGGAATINYHELPSLADFGSEEEILAALRELSESDADPRTHARTCWRFANEVKPGDLILARRGRSRIIGIGVVDEGYQRTDDETYGDRVGVHWHWNGEHTIRDPRSLPVATLTDATQRASLLRELELLLGTRDDEDEEPSTPYTPYSRADALADLFVPDSSLDEMIGLLRRKKNLILQGPPGVGKTFVAKRLAYLMLGAEDDDRLRFVQFHQAYTYEQFVRGYRPDGRGHFELANGPLYEIAETAKSDADNAYVLIIDEINRGNLSKILGEAMVLLEPDKRSPQWAVSLAYSRSEGDEVEPPFYLPENLYLIGTMNTADRSLAVVDYALRRRFSFVDLAPGFAHPRFAEHLIDLSPELRSSLLRRVGGVNRLISEDPNLGSGFEIGHSYFCRSLAGPPPWGEDPEAWIDDILRFEILPLLREYWYDDPGRLDQARDQLALR